MAMTKAANARQHPASRKDEQREMARQEQELASTPLPGETNRREHAITSTTTPERTESGASGVAAESADFVATPPSTETTARESASSRSSDPQTPVRVEAAPASNVVAMTARTQREATAPAPSAKPASAPATGAEPTAPTASANSGENPTGKVVEEAVSAARVAAEPAVAEPAVVERAVVERAVVERAPAARVTRARKRTAEGGAEGAVDLAQPPASVLAGSALLAGLELTIPDAPPANVARVKASKRGKRDVNYSWPKVDYAAMQEAWKECKPVYSRFWRHKDPGGAYRLGFSAFVAKAMLVAFEDVDAWVGTIRNDGRLEPVPGGRQQVGLVWPVEVENQVIDLWETLDRAKFPADFSLTKQHLAAAAILHGLKSVSQWLLESDNDDRFSIPVEADGRLRANRTEVEVTPV